MEKKYNTLLEGKIIVVNNFSFYTGKLDHAWNTGRICIVLYSDDEYEYVLPITHNVKEIYKKDFFYICERNFLEFYINRFKENVLGRKKRLGSQNSYDVNGFVDLRYVYKLPIVYRDEIGKVNYQYYMDLKEHLLNYHKNKRIEDIDVLSYKR